ncbi:MAG: fumarylacetoacetate hydrolase family protein [Desulfobacterales bacterium]|nr:fumarylacetoacetate hydrolase family protein [Desulfobacterales bacterium]
MRLITFNVPGGHRHIGALLDGNRQFVDLTASSDDACFDSMLAMIDAGERALDAARSLIARRAVVRELDGVRLAAPLPQPRQMRDFMGFEKHLRQARANRHLFGASGSERDPAKIPVPRVWYEQPLYYKCNRFSVIGTEEDIVCPTHCRMLDYELELAMVLGRGGKNIQREDAHAHIFGYCIFNDVSARDLQVREMEGGLGPAKGKDFDTGNVLGPWLVTADEIPDPYGLLMLARVNGEEWSRGCSSEMHHRFEDMLVHASLDETLYAGELFGSGTVGNGCGLEHGRFLNEGDIVELEIDGLGVLRNRIVLRSQAASMDANKLQGAGETPP